MRSVRSVALALLAAFLLPLIAAAYTFYAPLTVTNANAAYTMLPISVPVSNYWMSTNGVMKTTALDTRVTSADGLTVYNHTVAVDRTLAALALPTGQTNLLYTTGNTDLASMPVVVGYNGSVTTPDNATLEMAASGGWAFSGYVDTTGATAKHLVQKGTAYDLYAIASESISQTNTYTDATTDGYLINSGAVFAVVKAAVNAASVDAGSATAYVGTDIAGGPTYYVYRGALYFNTAAIPDTATVTAAYIRYFNNGKQTADGDWTLRIVNGQPARPSTPLVVGDFDETLYAGNGGTIGTAAITDGAWNNITLSVVGLGWINLTGTTKLLLQSENDINGIAPVLGANYVGVNSAESANPPTLVVTYTYTAANVVSGKIDVSSSASYNTSNSDAYLQKNDGVFNTAKTAVAATSVVGGNNAYTGVEEAAGAYYIYRGALYFSTAAIPDTATVTAASIDLYVENEYLDDGNWDLIVTHGAANPSDPLVVADYDETLYVGNGGSINTAAITPAAYNTITLNATGQGWVNLTGDTRLLLRGSNDTTGAAPGAGNQDMVVWTTADAATNTARLNVTYTVPTVTVSVPDVASGAHTITNTLSGGTFTMTVDATTQNVTTAISVLNTATDWTMLANTSAPYTTYLKGTMGGVERLWYQPIDQIRGIDYTTGTAAFTNGSAAVVGTATTWTSAMAGGFIKYDADNTWVTIASVTDATNLVLAAVYPGAGGAAAAYTMAPRLVDRDATQHGRIVWGTNPAGVTTAISSLVSVVQPSPGVAAGTRARDVAPTGPTGDIFASPAAALTTHPFYPFVNAITSVSTFSSSQVWRFFLIAAAVLAICVTLLATGGHIFIALLAGEAVWAYGVSLTIFPWWTIAVFTLFTVMSLLLERTPSV